MSTPLSEPAAAPGLAASPGRALPVGPTAALGPRVAAWLIDAALGGLAAYLLVSVTGGWNDVSTLAHLLAFKSVNGPAGHDLSNALHPGGGVAALRPVLGLLALVTVITAVAVAYRVATVAVWGAGIGKAALGLRVVIDRGASTTAEPPGWARSWRRWVVPQAAGLIPLPGTGLLAYAPAVRDRRRRGLHDRAAGTVVVQVTRR